jgi:hypothetical protein
MVVATTPDTTRHFGVCEVLNIVIELSPALCSRVPETLLNTACTPYQVLDGARAKVD